MEAEESDPGGAGHPTVFYGLWPRFSAKDQDADGAEDAGLERIQTD
jgi:hypothetical protein